MDLSPQDYHGAGHHHLHHGVELVRLALPGGHDGRYDDDLPVGITQVNDALGGFYSRPMSAALPGASQLPSPVWPPGTMAEALMIFSGVKEL